MSKNESRFAFTTSGDPEQDARFAREFAERDARLQANNCANGCGQMVWIDAYNRECKVCGFAYFTSQPLDAKGGTT